MVVVGLERQKLRANRKAGGKRQPDYPDSVTRLPVHGHIIDEARARFMQDNRD